MKDKTGRLNNVLALLMAVVIFVTGSYLILADTDTHTTTLNVSNTEPTVGNIGSQAVACSEGSSVNYYVWFDCTDANTVDDLNNTLAIVTLNMTGETDRTNTTGNCGTSDAGNVRTYNCSIPMQFYDKAGAWTINASCGDADQTTVYVSNVTQTVTVPSCDAVTLNDSAIDCGTLASPSSDQQCDTEQLTNAGNFNYSTSINLTGYNLTSTNDEILASAFNVNVSDSGGDGDAVAHTTPITITSATLDRGASETEVIYMWVDVPADKRAEAYTSSSAWSYLTSGTTD